MKKSKSKEQEIIYLMVEQRMDDVKLSATVDEVKKLIKQSYKEEVLFKSEGYFFHLEEEQVLFEDENDQDLILSRMDKVLLHKREVA